jgi:hypothetical protein
MLPLLESTNCFWLLSDSLLPLNPIIERRNEVDTGKGYFRPAEKEEILKDLEHDRKGLFTLYLFHIGEELEIKGSKFRVKNIKKKSIVLQLLKRNNL